MHGRNANDGTPKWGMGAGLGGYEEGRPNADQRLCAHAGLCPPPSVQRVAKGPEIDHRDTDLRGSETITDP
jgi:hypothetical protein